MLHIRKQSQDGGAGRMSFVTPHTLCGSKPTDGDLTRDEAEEMPPVLLRSRSGMCPTCADKLLSERT